ncbi:MAG: hypothetical protein AB1689_20775 [Thermodesulfobacteriota bacterium]
MSTRVPRGGAGARRLAPGLLLAAVCAGVGGCSAQRPPVPPRPELPAVLFVPPCDPQASIGMTEAGVAQLRARDEAWRTHVEILEAVIRGER